MEGFLGVAAQAKVGEEGGTVAVGEVGGEVVEVVADLGHEDGGAVGLVGPREGDDVRVKGEGLRPGVGIERGLGFRG